MGETTWSQEDAEYIIRFFNKQDVEVGKIWFCMDDCGMTYAIPTTTRMKSGGLSNIGNKKLSDLFNEINKNSDLQ